MRKIEIAAQGVTATAVLYDNATAEAIWQALPFDGRVNRWGDEIYFGIPVRLDPAPDARTEMEVGELAYWPPGNAFCIFWGPTTASEGDAPRAASPVNPLGRLEGDPTIWGAVSDGAAIRIKRV